MLFLKYNIVNNLGITVNTVIPVFFLSIFLKSIDILAKINYNNFSDNIGGVIMITATATDIQNNFGKYLQAVQMGDEIIILKNGIEVARLISKESSVSFLTDALTGFLKKDNNDKTIRAERAKKYESSDRYKCNS